jgi:hypothetical protein
VLPSFFSTMASGLLEMPSVYYTTICQ